MKDRIKLYNDDCLKVMDKLIEKGIQVDAIITDPPYRVISGGKPKYKGQPSGLLSKNDGKIFLHNDLKEEDWFPKIFKLLKDGGYCYIMTNTINLERYLRLARESGFLLHNLLVWEKNNCTPNRWYMKNCEYTLFLRKGKAKKINKVGSKTVHKFKNEQNKIHPSEKPIDLMELYVSNSTNENELVLDFTMGSGTTGVACINLNRRFIGIELDKNYFKIAEDRIYDFKGKIKLEYKIKQAKLYIKKFYEDNNGNIYVSYSGGKDSTILLHIARQLYPNIKAVFSNTTNENDDVIRFVKNTPNVDWVYPTYRGKPVNFIWAMEHYGFPFISKEVSQKVNEAKNTNSEKLRNKRLYGDKKGNGKLPKIHQWLIDEKFDLSNKCCDLLKKRPLLSYEAKTGLKPLVALMKSESMLRTQLAMNGKEFVKKGYPFLRTGWDENDIWEYAKRNSIRFAECYYGENAKQRTGCEFCAFGILKNRNKLDVIKHKKPKLYDKIMNTKNNDVTYSEALEKILKGGEK